MADVDITVSDNINAGVEQKLRGISDAARLTHSSVETLKKTLKSLQGLNPFETIAHSAMEVEEAMAGAGSMIPQIFNTALKELDAIATARAQQIGDNFTTELNARLVAGTGKSARDSASVFSAEFERLDDIAKLKATETGTAFTAELDSRLIAGTAKSARDSANVFSTELDRLDDIARLKAEQAGKAFTQGLNASFNIGGVTKSARESAAVFEEVAREQNRVAAAAQNLRDKLNPQQAIWNRLNVELAEYKVLAKAGAISTAELATASQRATIAARQQVAALNQTHKAVRATSGAFQQLVGLFVAGFGVRAFISAADAATTVSNKVRTVSKDLETYNKNLKAVYDVSISSRVAVESVATAFQRFSVAMKGTPAREVIGLIDTLTKALIVNGATTDETRSVITQLSQAFTKGKLDGDEFRSLMENLPGLADALAKSLKVPREELFAMSKQGLVTGEVIANALKIMKTQVDAAFKGTIPTISQALVVLSDQFILFMSQNTGAARVLAGVILTIGENLNWIIPVIVAFGTAWALVQMANLIRDVYLLAASFVAFLPTLVSATLAVLPWVVAIGLAVGAVLALAEIIAFLTGNTEELHQFLFDATNSVKNFVLSLAGLGAVADTDMSKLTAETSSTSAQLTEADGASKGLKDQITTTGTSGAQSFNFLTRSIEGTTEETNKLGNSLARAVEKAKELETILESKRKDDTPASDGTQPGSNPGSDPAFATGGSFRVGGRSGVDKNRVAFRATKGERVDVLTPQQQRDQAAALAGRGSAAGRGNTYITINTPNADSFHRSRRQTATTVQAMVGG